MYDSKIGRFGFPCFPVVDYRESRSPAPKSNQTVPCIHHEESKRLSSGSEQESSRKLLLKSSAFGGFVLPDGKIGEAAYSVASLNLDTSGYQDFCVLLKFSCNITANISHLHLRFQMFKQEKYQPFSIPISAGILYARETASMESNTFTLSVCDRDSMASPRCNYCVNVETAGAEAGGTGMIANPVLAAVIVENYES